MNKLPYVYVDFNGIEYSSGHENSDSLAITGYGTLASLSRQKIKLIEGMKLNIFTPNDIECEAEVHFNENAIDPAGRIGAWFAHFDHRNIHESKQSETEENTYPCFGCGLNLVTAFEFVGRNYKEVCPSCGVSVMAPLANPLKAT